MHLCFLALLKTSTFLTSKILKTITNNARTKTNTVLKSSKDS